MNNEKGVSLVESLLVVVAVSAIVFLLANIPNALGLITKSRHESLAREIAVKQIEDKRAINYINLVNDTSAIVDSRISLLPSGSGTVTIADCSTAICTNGEHIKQVSIVISWKDNNKDQNLTVETMIGEGGINQ